MMIAVIPGMIRSFLTFSISSETSSGLQSDPPGPSAAWKVSITITGLSKASPFGLVLLPDRLGGRRHPGGRVRVPEALDRLDHAERRVLDAEVPGGRDHAVVDAAVTLQGDEHHRLALDPPPAVLAPGRDVQHHVGDDRGLAGAGLGIAASEPLSGQQVLDDELAGEVRLQISEQDVFERRAGAAGRRLALVSRVVVVQARQVLGAPLGRLVQMGVDQEALRSIQSGSPLMLPFSRCLISASVSVAS